MTETAKHKIEVEFEFVLFCTECGQDLRVETIDDASPHYIEVRPCETCLEKARESAREEE